MRKRIKEIMDRRLATPLSATAIWLSTSEALELLNEAGVKMTASTLLKWVRGGSIEGKKIGKRYFLARKSIEGLLK